MKVDCSDAVKFLGEYQRMCITESCVNCPLSEPRNGRSIPCNIYKNTYPKDTVKIIQEWSDTHPQKTRAQVFIEMFPDAAVCDGVPLLIEPCDMLSRGSTCDKCKYHDEDHPCSEYWNEPATIKFGKGSSI